MIDIQDRSLFPSLIDLQEYVHSSMFDTFCSMMQEVFQAKAAIEFSRCSWESGWNIKFKKSSRTLCTIYPRTGYITVMIVIGRKEKALVEQQYAKFTPALKEIYQQSKEANDQRWLMIDLEDRSSLYEDVMTLIHIRADA